MKVDVIMCTWNSNKPWFKRCLASAKREIPLCHFIVVDRFSKDGTVDAVKQFFPETLIIESDVNLGQARQEAIRRVDTEWFVFMDDDLELRSKWFRTITSHVTDDTGAIGGLAVPTLSWLSKLSLDARKIVQSLRRSWKVWRVVYLSNTLVRTDLVRDWSPPIRLCSGEDAHLSRHIAKKGYNATLLYDLKVMHHGKWGLRSAKKNMWHSSGMRLVGHTGLTTAKLLWRLFVSPFKGLYVGLKLKEPLITPYMILSEFYSLKGWLQWDKFGILER